MISPKKGVCGGLSQIRSLFEDRGNLFCLPDKAIFHDWTVGLYEDDNIRKVPFVWSTGYIQSFRSTHTDYDSFVMFANEPTLKGQAWITAEQTAHIAAEIHKSAPDAKLIGPNHHPNVLGDATPTDWMYRFYNEYTRLGGSPDAIYANAFHVYHHSSVDGLSPTGMIDSYYDRLPSVLQSKPLWVTECGWKRYYDNQYTYSKKLFNEIDAHPMVEYWIGYSVYEYGDDWGFTDLYCGGRDLTPVGMGFRDAGIKD